MHFHQKVDKSSMEALVIAFQRLKTEEAKEILAEVMHDLLEKTEEGSLSGIET